MKYAAVLVLALIATISTTARAEVLFQTQFDPTANPDHLNGYFSGPTQIADRFVLRETSLLDGIKTWGYFLFSAPSEYRIEVLPEVQAINPISGSITSKPSATPILSFTSSNFLTSPSGYFHATNVEIVNLTFGFETALNLPAGAYWLSVAHTQPSTTTFAWNRANSPDLIPPIAFRTGSTSDWQNSSVTSHLAFEVFGSPVPEPSRAALLVLGLLGFGTRQFLVRRHRGHNNVA